MTDLDFQDSLSSSSPSRATDLIADFQARHDAWRRQGENLARLRADARAAAAREASSILAAARSDIHRIVVDARNALLALTAQLQVISEQAGEHGEPDDDVSDSVEQARRDLQRLLDDVRPELDVIADQVEQFAEPPSPEPIVEPVVVAPPVVESVVAVLEVPVVDEVEHEAALAAIAPLFEREDSLSVESTVATPVPVATTAPAPVFTPAPIVAPAPVFTPAPIAAPAPVRASAPMHAVSDRETARRGKAGVVTVLAVIAVSIVGGGGWWLSSYLEAAESLAPPLAAVPQVPRVTPSWADDRMPTLSASLVALVPGTPNPLSLEIEMRREAWVESSIDSGAPTSRILRAGETVRLLGARGISLTVRDAGAVVVSVNGGAHTPMGPDGQSVTRQFSASDRPTATP